MHSREFIGGLIQGLILQAGALALIIVLVRAFTGRAEHRAALARVRALPWLDTDAVLLLLALFGAQYVCRAISPFLTADAGLPATDTPVVKLLAETLIVPLSACCVYALIARRRGIRAATLFGDPAPAALRRNVGLGLLCGLAAIPFVAAADLSSRAILQSVNYPVTHQPILDHLLGNTYPAWLRLTIVFVACSVAPIVEEAVFRGLFLPLALRQARPPAAIAGVSFMFAAMHMHVPSLVPLFVLSAAFSAAYLATGSLLVPMLMHALFNGVMIAMLLIVGDPAAGL